MIRLGSLSYRLSSTGRTIASDKQLLVGCIGLLFLLILMVGAPLFATEDPTVYGPDRLFGVGEGGHILGTNHMGQDVYSMIIYGVRTSIKVAVVSALISGILGVLIGGIAGFFGGKVDIVVSEIINIFMMLPSFFLILLIVALFGNSLTNVMVVIGITTWPGNAKLMRAQALSLRQRVFVKSAEAMGESKMQILFKYILPNGIFPVISNTTMGMASAILTEAGLSFLGLGDPTVISWGQMIYSGKQYLTSAWWISTFSGVAIVITVLIFYLLGDGMNRVLDPRYNERRA